MRIRKGCICAVVLFLGFAFPRGALPQVDPSAPYPMADEKSSTTGTALKVAGGCAAGAAAGAVLGTTVLPGLGTAFGALLGCIFSGGGTAVAVMDSSADMP